MVGTGAEICPAVDGSCLMHIVGGLDKQGAPVRTVHLYVDVARDRNIG